MSYRQNAFKDILILQNANKYDVSRGMVAAISVLISFIIIVYVKCPMSCFIAIATGIDLKVNDRSWSLMLWFSHVSHEWFSLAHISTLYHHPSYGLLTNNYQRKVILLGGNRRSLAVTSQWILWRLKSPATPLFQPFVQEHIKRDIKAPCHCPLWGKSAGDPWILLK